MHPILQSKTRTSLYFFAWLPIAMVGSVQTLLNNESVLIATIFPLLHVMSAAALFLSSFYICRSFPIKEQPLSRLVPTWASSALILSTLWFGILWAIDRTLINLVPAFKSLDKPFSWVSFLGILLTGIIFYALTLAIHYLLISLEDRNQAEKRSQDAAIKARDAELKALRAQLNPHFLFNSLNSISALTTQNPQKAREMCVLLSDFLRKSLRLGEKVSVTLGEEIDLLKYYLGIEKVRFGNRLETVWEIDESLLATPIPTLLLQPLVENAIKHGIGQVIEGGPLSIHAKRHGDFLEIRVENPADEDMENTSGLGLGQRQVKERLKGKYDNRCYFETSIKEGRYAVVLGLPLENA